jgi:hypothetical protein
MLYPSHQQLEIVKIWVNIRDKYPENEDLAIQLCVPVSTFDEALAIAGIEAPE